jgi:predicted metal-dependent hydrolase
MWSNARSDAALEAALPRPIEIRRVRNARRFRLRFDEASGTLKLTCPWRASRRAALGWALDQRTWIEAQLARALPPEPFEPGASIPVCGAARTLVWNQAWPRCPELSNCELRCGGTRTGIPRRVEMFLRALALETMSREVAEFAKAAGVSASAVAVGDAGTRWGSCSADGRIRLSWRLIMATPAGRRYVVAHEVAHLAHLNHGPEFKALEARLFGPGLADAKAALRREGPRLRRIGRAD